MDFTKLSDIWPVWYLSPLSSDKSELCTNLPEGSPISNVEYYLFVLRLKALFLKLYLHWTSAFKSKDSLSKTVPISNQPGKCTTKEKEETVTNHID